MTAPSTPGHAGPPLDPHDMVVIDRAFRRESLLLASCIAGVADADRGRAGALAAHLRWYRRGPSAAGADHNLVVGGWP